MSATNEAAGGSTVQVSGTTPAGWQINNSSGALKAAFGLAASANDWITGSAAGDAVLGGDATKKLHLGALSAAAPLVTLDLANARVGVGTAAPSVALHIKFSSAAATVENTSTSATAFVQVQGPSSRVGVLETYGASVGGNKFGNTQASATALYCNACSKMMIGSLDAVDVILGANNAEVMRLDAANSQLKFPAAGIAANGSGAITAPGAIAPAAVAVQEWLQIRNPAGALRYIQLWG